MSDFLTPEQFQKLYLSYGAHGKQPPEPHQTGQFWLSLYYFLNSPPEPYKVVATTVITHPSEWCKIPSTWRHKTELDQNKRAKVVRALRITENGLAWDIECKDSWLQSFKIDSEKFRRDYEAMGAP